MSSDTRWADELSVPTAQVVRGQWIAGGTHPAAPVWQPAAILARAGDTCRAAGLAGAPALVMRVAAAANTYSRLFLPWGWDLQPALPGTDERVLTWVRGEEQITDVLWAEAWDVPLPPSRDLAGWGGRVRLVDLARPFTSREYLEGQHVALAPREVA